MIYDKYKLFMLRCIASSFAVKKMYKTIYTSTWGLLDWSREHLWPRV
jgi:hypothetical protein